MAFVLHLDSAGNWDFLCSGTLVSPNVVLTAGHCAVDDTSGAPLDPSGFGVVTGAVDWTDATDRHISTVSQVLVSPSYDPSGPGHDAALLVLSSAVSGQTIPLWGTGSVAAGTRAWIAGWGDTYDEQSDPQTVLQWAPTTVQSTTFCGRPFLAGYPYDASSDLCALNPPSYDTATCEGDSGGPLLAKDASGNLLEIGLTSVGPADCDTQTPDYYTAIKPIASWVQSEVAAAAGSGQAPPATGQGSASAAPAPASTPAMTLSDARSYVRQTLVHLFGGSYRRAHAVKLSCARMSSIRVRCAFTFRSGPNDYWGNVTPYYYTAQNGETYWDSKYKTNRVNDHCYFDTLHRTNCATHPRSGSW
jgi:secreted trypsin-like serine protease